MLTYKFALTSSKLKKHKLFLKDFVNMNKNLAKKLLFLFIERCKFKNSLCFMQYRRLLPTAEYGELLEIFEGRKAFLVEHVSRMAEMER